MLIRFKIVDVWMLILKVNNIYDINDEIVWGIMLNVIYFILLVFIVVIVFIGFGLIVFNDLYNNLLMIYIVRIKSVNIFGICLILNMVINMVVNNKLGIVCIILRIKCDGIVIYFVWIILFVYSNVIGMEIIFFRKVLIIVIWIVFSIGCVIWFR